jgi:hypothetical protein
MSIPPEKAARFTTFALIGAVGAAALIVALLLLPRPDVSAELTPVTAPEDRGGPTPSVGADKPEQTVVWTDLEAVMNQIHKVEVAQVEQPDPENTELGPDDVEATRIAQQGLGEDAPRGLPGWRYIGSLESGGAFTAVVMVEAKQHFISPGARVAGYDIADITDEYVLVETDSGQRRVDREAPPEASLQGGSRGAVNTPRRRPGDPAQGETPEERLDRLRGGGR